MSVDRVIFFLPKKTLNEATIYYTDVIKDSFLRSGYEVKVAEKFNELDSRSIIFVMSAKWCFLVKIMYPRSRIVTWFQGVGAEEIFLNKKTLIGKYMWHFVELFATRFSNYNFFVSQAMKSYLDERYNYNSDNFYVMPCFNKQLNMESFNYNNKYEELKFVYAGSLDKWQCIEQTLELYKQIEDAFPEANITILAKNYDLAKALINNFKIKNYQIKFVSLDSLDEELSKYKYGFLLREKHIVNTVATPTKMNSYLANGVIPIYTDVVDSFNEHIKKQYFIELNSDLNIVDWFTKFSEYECKFSSNTEKCIKDDIVDIFNSYYCKEKYTFNLMQIFKNKNWLVEHGKN